MELLVTGRYHGTGFKCLSKRIERIDGGKVLHTLQVILGLCSNTGVCFW